ncbi:hypothetical protein HMPREF9141_0898 [Prevotella multiformis DSM 16608]|uniref:Uncharacterized protein n=1 Tax=Prevotella multiformis DSM 16608 TaxID=888743 RepID=F0F5N2_9BACT|nr:hypothetical protein HMPREF9141_0898 [Prevotella multiformis DSM 16608]
MRLSAPSSRVGCPSRVELPANTYRVDDPHDHNMSQEWDRPAAGETSWRQELFIQEGVSKLGGRKTSFPIDRFKPS